MAKGCLMIVLTSSAIFSLLSFSIHCSGLLKQLDVYICDFWNRFVHRRQCSQPQEILEFSLFFPRYYFEEQTPCKPASAKTTESIQKLYSTPSDSPVIACLPPQSPPKRTTMEMWPRALLDMWRQIANLVANPVLNLVVGLSQEKCTKKKRPDNPTSQLLPIMGKKCCSGGWEGRKDKGGGGGKMVCGKVVCVCVWKMVWWKMVCDKVVCERWCGESWCMTKMVWWKMACDKVVCERSCVEDGVWQSGVWKMVCDGVWKMVCDRVVRQRWCVKDGVWQSGVWKMVCDKVVWKMVCDKVVSERWCVTKMCVKDGVSKMVGDKVVCERWCVKDGVSKMVCERKMVCKRWCAKDGVWKMVCDKVVVKDDVWKIVCVTKWCDSSSSRRCTAPATRQPAAGQRRPRAHQLVLRLPHDSQPRASVYCACHTTASHRPAAATHSPALLQEALCTAPATRQPAGQRRPRAHQLLQEALCTAPATDSQRASGGHARTSSSRRLYVLRLPRDS